MFLVLSASSVYAYGDGYWIKVVNEKDGEISVSTDEGGSWRTIGHVLVPIDNNLKKPDKPGFTASDYGMDSSIVATAVNGVHIRVCKKPEEFSRLFSLLPVEFKYLCSDYKSYKGTAMITDMDGEEGIFGKDYAPYIGNRVYLLQNDAMDLLPEDYVPHLEDELIIKVIPPSIEKPIKYIWIENKINGYVMVVYEDLTIDFVARVLKPVAGVGGFTGTSLAGRNKIRANHPGVICISTSKHFGDVGPDLNPPEGEGGQTGFQVVPFEHTLEYISEETNYEGTFGYARLFPVYLILMPRSNIFIEEERFSSTDKEGIIARREAVEKARGENPEIKTDPEGVMKSMFEIKDRDGSSLFGRLYSFEPEENLYGTGFFFGGYFKAGTCDVSIKKRGETEFIPVPEYNEGKDFTVFEDVEEIKIYYKGY